MRPDPNPVATPARTPSLALTASLAQVLEAADAGAAPPPRAQLLEALRCTPYAQAG